MFCIQSEELLRQKKTRTDMIQSEDMLDVLRKEYEMMRLEFEQNMAAHEQSGPINKEMRHLITSLQNHNNQLKGDCHRYKRKYKDVCIDSSKVCERRDTNKRNSILLAYSSLNAINFYLPFLLYKAKETTRGT